MFRVMHKKTFEEMMDAIFVDEAESGVIIDCNRAACGVAGPGDG